METIFSSPKPPATQVPPPAPKLGDEELRIKEEARRTRGQFGRASTLLTGGEDIGAAGGRRYLGGV